MNQERYEFGQGPIENSYAFISIGPKGEIQKVVAFQRVLRTKKVVYNLVFGDWDQSTNSINDSVVSDNKDRQKILATVAYIVLQFMEENPDSAVFAKGSTAARTRLYQMGLALSLADIPDRFELYGCRQGKWELFQKGINYRSFYMKWNSSI